MIAVLLLVLLAGLAGSAAFRESVAIDELAHIGAGVSYWKLDLRMNPEHPPLVKLLAAAPLVGLSVTIWYYLQLISHYLCAPMMAVILTGVLWKKANTQGAIGGIIAGFSVAAVVFLDQVLHLGLPILSLPIFNSFLHRDLVVLVVAAVATVIVSNITSQPEDFKKALVNVSAEFTKPWEGIDDYRTAALVLFIFTDVLWYLFR